MRDRETEGLKHEAEIDRLASLEGPNVPEAIAGTKTPGPMAKTTSAERRKMREKLSPMLASGDSDDRIYEAMKEAFGLSRNQYKTLKEMVFKRWASEDTERNPYLKAAARRRILK